MRLTILYILFINLFSSLLIYAQIGKEFESFENLNTVIKQSNFYYTKKQPILSDLFLDSSNITYSEYENSLINSIQKYRVDSGAILSVNSMFRYSSNDDFNYYVSPMFVYNNRYFDFNMEYRLDTKYMDDSNYVEGIGYTKRSSRARMNLASFMLKAGKNIRFGFDRSNENWSYIGLTSPIISDNPYSYDKIKFEYITDHLQLELFTTLLDSSRGESRRLYAKHVNFIFRPGKFVISPGFMETMLEATKNDLFRVSSLYPFVPAFLNMMNREAGGNSIIGSDLLLKYSNLINFYIQFVVDDWQIDDKSIVGNQEPNLWALNGAIDLFLPYNINLGLYYQRVQNWVYYVNYREQESFLYYNKSLGAYRNNFDKTSIMVLKDYKNFRFKYIGEYERLGKNTINNGNASYYWQGFDLSNFPVKDTLTNFENQKMITNSVEVWYKDLVSVSLTYSITKNYNNILDNNKNRINFDISTYPQIIFNLPNKIFR